MRGVVGLISDFGWGPYAGIMAEVVSCLGAEPLHIDHSVPSFRVEPGAYVVLQAYRWLPRGSSLAAVIDPGVGTSRRAIVIKTKNYYLVGPDNGVLYPAALDDGIDSVYVIDENELLEVLRRQSKCKGFEDHKVSSTFHGRDLFAPVAALLSLGEDPRSFLREVDRETLVKLDLEFFEVKGGRHRFKVIYIDKFGNVALSARILPFPLGTAVRVRAGDREVRARVSRTFQEVNVGEALVYLNSFGFLEVAVNQGSASETLKTSIGDILEIEKV